MSIYTAEDYVNAKRLMTAIEEELDLGTKYFNQAGKQLNSVKAVILALKDEGKVTAEPTEERKELYRQMAAHDVLGSGEGGILWTPR